MKLKLSSSAKIKRRYLLIYAQSKSEVEKAILDYIGILGWAKAAPIFVKSKDNIVLAIDRREIDNIRAAFELCSDRIKIIRVSGTIKGLK